MTKPIKKQSDINLLRPRRWKDCSICHAQKLVEYIDGKTVAGPWANMCVDCFGTYGIGLGLGKGQFYRSLEGVYTKIAG